MAATLFKTLPSLQLMPFPKVSYNIFIDQVDNVDYQYETARLESFKNWPVSYMKPEKLAAAGFYFTGEADIVKCFECRVEIYRWLEGDDPMVDHRRECPTCRFICKIPCGNVPVDINNSTIPLPIPEGNDVCGSYLDYDLPPEPYCNSFLMNLQSTRPKYPEYMSYEARLCTFEFWPKSMSQTEEQLSDAGFYYTGKGDQVLCFHCGVGVKDWEPADDPWEQHAIWFPDCNFLLTVKGQGYIKKITSPSKDMTSHVEKEEQSKEMGQDECNPGTSSQSSQGSHDSCIDSMSSNNSSLKSSTENLTNAETEACKPIDDARICKICYNAELCKLFIPCGHLVACAECAMCMKTCPVCRELVTSTVQVFFS